MKFSCEKALLQNAILTASRAVSPKSTIPALEGLLLEAEDSGTVFLTGYNQETGIRSAIQADVTEAGSMVLSARLFGEIVRKMPDDTLLFQEEALKVHIACGMSEFDLMGIDPEDFPELAHRGVSKLPVHPGTDPPGHDRTDPVRCQRRREPPGPHRQPLCGG